MFRIRDLHFSLVALIIIIIIFTRFANSTNSKMAIKILCRSLELEPPQGFASCLV